jgi:hypothetical protein
VVGLANLRLDDDHPADRTARGEVHPDASVPPLASEDVEAVCPLAGRHLLPGELDARHPEAVGHPVAGRPADAEAKAAHRSPSLHWSQAATRLSRARYSHISARAAGLG